MLNWPTRAATSWLEVGRKKRMARSAWRVARSSTWSPEITCTMMSGWRAAQLVEPRHQPVGGDAFGRGDAHDAGHLAVETGEMALDRGGVRQHRLGLHQHAARRRRHLHAVAMAVEQLGTEPALERLDSTADGCLLGVELRRSSAEASGLGDGEEKTHVVPVAEDVRHLALTWAESNHRNNRYNVLRGPNIYLQGPLWFILHH